MELEERLSQFILEKERAGGVEIKGLERITTGASRETWLFTARIITQGESCEIPMVLRKDPKSGLSYSTRAEEFMVLKKAHEHGVPVPKPLYFSEDYLDRPFLIMERVFGETYPKRLLNDDAYAMTRGQWEARLGEILARIHQIPLSEELGFLKKASVAEQIERNEGVWRATKLNQSPVLECTFRWLKQNIPQEHPYCFIHADFRMGNIMFDEQGVKCILDWELAQIGDPMYDIAIICMRSWRFDKPQNRVGGFGREEGFLEAYQMAGGYPVDRQRIRYWEILANIFWATVTVAQSRFFVEQPRGNLEYAKLGRRTSECEFELMELLKGVE